MRHVKPILFSCALLLLSGIFSSCKKEKTEPDEDEECEISVASIAGKYKLAAAVYQEAAGDRDVLHDIYEDCELDDTNELKADKTFVYTDAGTKCSPDGSTSGTWDINTGSRILVLNSGMSTIISFNCKDLVVTYRDAAGNLVKETYRRQ